MTPTLLNPEMLFLLSFFFFQEMPPSSHHHAGKVGMFTKYSGQQNIENSLLIHCLLIHCVWLKSFDGLGLPICQTSHSLQFFAMLDPNDYFGSFPFFNNVFSSIYIAQCYLFFKTSYFYKSLFSFLIKHNFFALNHQVTIYISVGSLNS